MREEESDGKNSICHANKCQKVKKIFETKDDFIFAACQVNR